MVNEDGSIPLENSRREMFCHLVAVSGLSFVDAYCESSPTPREKNHGAKVNASKMGRRPDCEARIAYLKREAQALADGELKLDRAGIAALQDTVTEILLNGARVAQIHDAGLALQMRQNIVRHSGRQSRTNANLGGVKKRPANDGLTPDRVLSNLRFCECHG
ncbi:hypothetical protein [Pseudooceanicola atlanticus]|uniref:hypothetical protein n=1 Tax=Pseudooceanicola atlanticus TaxID=1461694 RepID=UPI0023571980|nr:hypothetical protein [Pseudooceanicola atlanticus]